MLVDQDINKIGNAIIYIVDRIKPAYFTKVLKLLYILDETSVKETGVPFTWLDYKAWKMGPVPVFVYNELRDILPNKPHDSVLSQFISVESTTNPAKNDRDSFIVSAQAEFCDDEFSEYDIELMDKIIKLYGGKTASELIEILHSEGSLWHNVVTAKDLNLDFSLMQNRTDFSIPFTDLIKDDEIKQLSYKSAYSSMMFDLEAL